MIAILQKLKILKDGTRFNELVIYRSSLEQRRFGLFSTFKINEETQPETIYMTKEAVKFTEKLENFIKTVKDPSTENFEKLTKNILEGGKWNNKEIFYARFLGFCLQEKQWHIGKQFFLYLQNKNSLNLGIINHFLRLCYRCNQQCNKNDHNVIKNLYKEIKSQHNYLDVSTCESLIISLSITDEFQKCFKLLKHMKDYGTPSQIAFSAIIIACFRNKQNEEGWKLIKEFAENYGAPSAEVLNMWLTNNENIDGIEKVLEFITRNYLFINEESANLIGSFYKKIKNGKAKIVKIDPRGKCRGCNTKLKSSFVSNEDFNDLRSQFLKIVVVGKDVFIKSKPEEINLFRKFLEKTGKVDIVLDGLNVAYYLNPEKKRCKATMLSQVVENFVNRGKKVMLLGRKHMLNWNSIKMKYIMDNTSWFFADNVSADDPLILYAAMYSGLGTIFISNDIMRNHKFTLMDSTLIRTFSRWQQGHQFRLIYASTTEMILHKHSSCLQEPQFSHGKWHLPLQKKLFGHRTSETPFWLCLT